MGCSPLTVLVGRWGGGEIRTGLTHIQTHTPTDKCRHPTSHARRRQHCKSISERGKGSVPVSSSVTFGDVLLLQSLPHLLLTSPFPLSPRLQTSGGIRSGVNVYDVYSIYINMQAVTHTNTGVPVFVAKMPSSFLISRRLILRTSVLKGGERRPHG